MYGNCVHCGAFTRLNRMESCAPCYKEDEILLEQAREVLAREGRLSVFDLAERLPIEPERVFLWLQQRRIKSGLFCHNCPSCGRDLLNGFCDCMNDSYAEEALAMEAVSLPCPPERFYSALRVERLKQRYWDYVSGIRRKQKRDIWLPT